MCDWIQLRPQSWLSPTRQLSTHLHTGVGVSAPARVAWGAWGQALRRRASSLGGRVPHCSLLVPLLPAGSLEARALPHGRPSHVDDGIVDAGVGVVGAEVLAAAGAPHGGVGAGVQVCKGVGWGGGVGGGSRKLHCWCTTSLRGAPYCCRYICSI